MKIGMKNIKVPWKRRTSVRNQPTRKSRRRQYRVRHGAWRRTAAEDLKDVPVLDIGGRIVTCPFCMALRWRDESASLCCREGRVQLPALEQPPPFLRRFLTRNYQVYRFNYLGFVCAVFLPTPPLPPFPLLGNSIGVCCKDENIFPCECMINSTYDVR